MYVKRVVKHRTLRVLDAIMQLSGTGSITLRKLAAMLGVSTSSVCASVQRLEKHGLVTYKHYRCNTIRPCVEFIPAEKLGAQTA